MPSGGCQALNLMKGLVIKIWRKFPMCSPPTPQHNCWGSRLFKWDLSNKVLLKNNKQNFYPNFLVRENSLGAFTLEDNRTPNHISMFNCYSQSSGPRTGLLRGLCGFEVFDPSPFFVAMWTTFSIIRNTEWPRKIHRFHGNERSTNKHSWFQLWCW